MDVKTMVARVLRMTDLDPPPMVATYASPQWREHVQREQRLFKQTEALQQFDHTRVVAEVCRLLLLEKLDLDDTMMLTKALQVRAGEEDATEAIRETEEMLEKERKRWR